MTNPSVPASAEKTKSVLLLSGGLDSTTLCALASDRRREIHALTFDYHQRHRCELDAARQDYVLNSIQGGQVLITCCDEEEVSRRTGGKIIRIQQGHIL